MVDIVFGPVGDEYANVSYSRRLRKIHINSWTQRASMMSWYARNGADDEALIQGINHETLHHVIDKLEGGVACVTLDWIFDFMPFYLETYILGLSGTPGEEI
jgi:hypothetical protein